MVVIAHGKQLTDQSNRLVVDGFIGLAAVAVLHHAHARAPHVEQLVARTLQGGDRERSRSSIEVRHSGHGSTGILLGWRQGMLPGRTAPEAAAVAVVASVLRGVKG